jgi:Domain of unknown function (DUF6285)
MTQTPPDSALLAASIDYLETQLLPALEGEHRFKTRLVVNALKTLTRGEPSSGHGTVQEADEAARQLALKIRNHQLALNDPRLLALIESQLRHSLAVNNPKWLV